MVLDGGHDGYIENNSGHTYVPLPDYWLKLWNSFPIPDVVVYQL